jgi:hypothetical protein
VRIIYKLCTYMRSNKQRRDFFHVLPLSPHLSLPHTYEARRGSKDTSHVKSFTEQHRQQKKRMEYRPFSTRKQAWCGGAWRGSAADADSFYLGRCVVNFFFFFPHQGWDVECFLECARELGGSLPTPARSCSNETTSTGAKNCEALIDG